MALTLLQTSYLHSGIVRPLEITLFDLSAQVSQRHAQYFLGIEKDIPETDLLAISYKTKIENISKSILKRDSELIRNINSGIIEYISPSGDFNNFRIFRIDEWETLWSNSIANVFERVADVKATEKTAYDLIQARKK